MKSKITEHFLILGGIVAPLSGFSPMSDAELGEIEKGLGNRLPDDYREFLQVYGGASFGHFVGYPIIQSRAIFETPQQASLTYDSGAFAFFYGSGSDVYSLAWNISTYRVRMPDTIIPIAGDCFGNQICIGVDGRQRGRIYFWDHENEWDEEGYLEDYGKPMPLGAKFQNLYFVADSFEEFILLLRPVE